MRNDLRLQSIDVRCCCSTLYSAKPSISIEDDNSRHKWHYGGDKYV